MKSDKNILILATYPIRQPKHGGQKRLDAIYKAYNKVFKKVIFSAVYFRSFYPESGRYDIPVCSSTELKIHQSPFTGDIICGEAVFEDKKVKKKLTKLLLSYNPGIIHIEQPFIFLGLKKLLNELNLNPKIIFGSQNIEGPMKREILEGVNVPEEIIKDSEKLITNLEIDLSKNSDLVVACTKSDLEVHKNMGAQEVVLAPNGTSLINSSSKAESYWLNKFEKLNIDKIVLFVGSAHPPNWIGFFDMIGKGLGFVPFGSRIIIAGSICDYFDQNINENNLNLEDCTFWQRAFSAGRLSEDKLGALIKLADVIVLPITEGGGSNLKTAEAILANKKVVATDHALRSFEWFKDFPGVWTSNSKKDFQKNIIKAIDEPFINRNETQNKLASTVEWNYCLNDLIKKAARL